MTYIDVNIDNIYLDMVVFKHPKCESEYGNSYLNPPDGLFGKIIHWTNDGFAYVQWEGLHEDDDRNTQAYSIGYLDQ